jgi:RNA polymerase sigma-70 factor, ECF subfamily
MIGLIEDLYDSYSKKLTSYVRSLCKDGECAEELVQETFTRAVQNSELLAILPDYKRKSWLFTVLKNCFIDFKNREKRESPIDEDMEITTEVDVDLSIDSRMFLASLPENMRDIVFKRYWLGMNSSEIAKELSIPAGTVRYNLHLAMNKARKKLQKSDYKIL